MSHQAVPMMSSTSSKEVTMVRMASKLSNTDMAHSNETHLNKDNFINISVLNDTTILCWNQSYTTELLLIGLCSPVRWYNHYRL